MLEAGSPRPGSQQVKGLSSGSGLTMVASHGARGWGALGAPFIKPLMSFARTLLSGPDHLPDAFPHHAVIT